MTLPGGESYLIVVGELRAFFDCRNQQPNAVLSIIDARATQVVWLYLRAFVTRTFSG